MLRLNPPGYQRIAQAQSFDITYGGSEANVAIALANWGVETSYITCLPDNEVGKTALRSLKKFDVDTSRSLLHGDRIGLLYLETGAGTRASKVIYDRAHSSLATLQPGTMDWKVALIDSKWFHWSGITPALSASAAALTLEALKVAKSLGLTISCDLNYRSNLWKWGKKPSDVMPELVSYCDVMLGDGNTNALYFGVNNEDYITVAKETMKLYPHLKFLALTARQAHHASHHDYKGFLYSDDTMFESASQSIPQIVDRIGTGDAYMAGLIYALLQDKPNNQYAVDFAAASAAMKHTVYGDHNLISKEEIESLMAGNTGGKVSR